MSKANSEAELLAGISRKLDTAIAFLAASAALKDEGGVFKRLFDNGHSAEEIARMMGITENAAAIRMTRLRQKTGKSKPKVHKNDKSGTEEGAPS